MPHHIVKLLQSSTGWENPVMNLKKSVAKAKATNRREETRAVGRKTNTNHNRSMDGGIWQCPSSDEEGDAEEVPSPTHLAVPRNMVSEAWNSIVSPESKDYHHHRISFHGMHFGRSTKDHHHAYDKASIKWQLESPPAVFYGDAENSTGALVSGQLFINVKPGEEIEITSFNAWLDQHVTQKKPHTAHCHDCSHQHTELKKFNLLQHPVIMAEGQYSFPVSFLLEGNLPVSMDSPLSSIAYEFKAEAVTKTGAVLKYGHILDVKRSLPVPATPHHSVRVFPPTNIKASVYYPHIIHPVGNNNLTLRLDGIAKLNDSVNTIEFWKLKKLTWRLEEMVKTVAPACSKHCPKDETEVGLVRTETHVIGERTLFSGWKSNYNGASDSNVELEIDYCVSQHANGLGSPREGVSCDNRTKDGTTEVTHQLMIEMVVSQEWAPAKNPRAMTQTGVGRILRMHFGTVLTEHPGIGISWDNEAPPIYQDVPESPPQYADGPEMAARWIGEAGWLDVETMVLEAQAVESSRRNSSEGPLA